jgi:hypothetical protein
MNISVHQRTYRAEDAFVDLVVGDLEDFMVGVLLESLDPLASLGLLVLLTWGPLDNFSLGDLELGDLVDLRFLAMAVAQTRAKRRKRVFREFIVICCTRSMKLKFQVHEKLQVCKIMRNERAFKSFGFSPRYLRRRGGKPRVTESTENKV